MKTKKPEYEELCPTLEVEMATCLMCKDKFVRREVFLATNQNEVDFICNDCLSEYADNVLLEYSLGIRKAPQHREYKRGQES